MNNYNTQIKPATGSMHERKGAVSIAALFNNPTAGNFGMRGKKLELTGQRFGKLTVLGYEGINKGGRTLWRCLCDCGEEKVATGTGLLKGSPVSCGCSTHSDRQAQVSDITGHRFGLLIAVEYVGKNKWGCICDCGNEAIIGKHKLICGHTRSCGCLKVFKPGVAAQNQVLANYKRSAYKRNHKWEISNEDFFRMTQMDCYYCGIPPFNNYTHCGSGDYKYNGLDRVDSSIGYVISNVVPCCGICNRMKHRFSIEEFTDWVHRASNHLKQLP